MRFLPGRFLWALVLLLTLGGPALSAEVSDDTDACLACHSSVTPGIVADWEKSRHARTTPEEALKKGTRERRVSNEAIPERFLKNSVGCAECHLMNADQHKDSFEHQGYQVHIVVSPSDCAVCHPVEREQYSRNMMSHAYGNLVNNAVYEDLTQAINRVQIFKDGALKPQDYDALTEADSCLFCHGTVVEVKGTVSRDTEMGEMEFPVLSGWPNNGVGRINPDGSQGSCSACHARHQYAIEVARKPATCSECHKGPDVPAKKVYDVSKHGNIYHSLHKDWNFQNVPWRVGVDFTAPTCAACHVSLLVDAEGTVVVERTHEMSDRLPWRIFGPIYAHAHPKSPDTTLIRNKAGLPLPTDLDGQPATEYLISREEQLQRQKTLQKACFSCHGSTLVQGHWERFENTIATTNAMTLAATQILLTAWEKGLARGPAHKDSLFNEPIEKKWVEQWLFYANSTRFSSAMGGADYGVFDNGRWNLSRNLAEMKEWLDLRKKGR